METTVTLRDVMTREFVGVGESDTVRGAAQLLTEDRANCAVVLRGTEPVGLVTAGDLLGVVADGGDLTASVGNVMSDPPASLSPDQRLDDAMAALSSSDHWHVLVVEDGAVVGVVDARDVVTAGASRPPAADREGSVAALAGAGAVEDRGTVDGGYSEQSVCEVCGSLARELVSVNGQLVCSDCRSV